MARNNCDLKQRQFTRAGTAGAVLIGFTFLVLTEIRRNHFPRRFLAIAGVVAYDAHF